MIASKSGAGGGGFLTSKWQSVDESKLEDQAMTTSKWDELEPVKDDDHHPGADFEAIGSTSITPGRHSSRRSYGYDADDIDGWFVFNGQ